MKFKLEALSKEGSDEVVASYSMNCDIHFIMVALFTFIEQLGKDDNEDYMTEFLSQFSQWSLSQKGDTSHENIN